MDLAGSAAAHEISDLAELIRPRVEAARLGKERLAILNKFFFQGLRFEAEENADSDEGLLPASVLERRRGTCVGLTGVYLAFADILHIPVAAVSAPNHMFVRFDDGHDRINVELLETGKAKDDGWYVSTKKIPAAAIESGVFLRSLSDREFLAYVYANVGILYSRIGDFANSRILYDAALREVPEFPAALYNLGNDFLNRGDNRRAIETYDHSLSLYPTDLMALNNRGIALCRLGKARRARRDFERAIEIDPGFSLARTNLATLTCARSRPTDP